MLCFPKINLVLDIKLELVYNLHRSKFSVLNFIIVKNKQIKGKLEFLSNF